MNTVNLILIEEMKLRIKKHPYLKELHDNMIKEGLSEDEAFKIMFQAWVMQR